MEADSPSFAVGNDYLAVTICQTYLYYLVVFSYGDGIYPILSRTRIRLQAGLFDNTILGTEYQIVFAIVFGVLQIFYTYKRIYLIVGLYIQHILYRPALAYLASFGYIVDSHPIAFAFLGEKQHIVVHRGGINIFDEVFVFCSASFGAYAASILSLKLGKRSTFDISLVRNGDNHLVVGIEIFGIHLFARIYYLGTTRVAEFVFKLQHFVDNDLHSSFDFCQNIAQIFYTFQKLFVLQTQLILLHSSELAKSEFYDISSLPLGKRETLH